MKDKAIHKRSLISSQPAIVHYLCGLLLLIPVFGCQPETQADLLESVRDLSVRDNGNEGDASDIEINFEKQFNPEVIEVYRIFLLKAGKTAEQDLSFLQSLSEAHYTEVLPADIFPVQGKALNASMLDTEGDPITEGPAYRAALVSIPENPELWSPSVTYSEEDLILSRNNLVSIFSNPLEAGAGSLAGSAQGRFAMAAYDVVADLVESSDELSPIHFFDRNGSFNESNQSFSFMGGSAYDSQGNLYIAHTSGGEILKVSPTGAIDTLVHTGRELSEPDGIFIDSHDVIYVADRENGAVIRISPTGVSELVAVSDPGIRGLTGDEAGNLYATINRQDGWVIKISPDGQTTRLAQIPTFVPPDYLPPFISWVGYLTYHEGNLYVAGTSTHRIYIIDDAGSVNVFAGSGTKLLPNGDARTAHFNRPLGLAFSADGQRLIISGCTDTSPQHVQASRPSRLYQIELVE